MSLIQCMTPRLCLLYVCTLLWSSCYCLFSGMHALYYLTEYLNYDLFYIWLTKTSSKIIIVLSSSTRHVVQAFASLCNDMSPSVCQYVVFLLVIALSVLLRITTSKNRFGSFKLF